MDMLLWVVWCFFFYAGGIRFFRSLQEAKGILVPRVPTGATTKFVGAATAV